MLRRNLHLVPEVTTVFVPKIPKPGPVYAISGKGRFWHDSEVGRFTSANSAMIYRDRLLGDEFYGIFFVSEPVHNLVHREVLTSDERPGETQGVYAPTVGRLAASLGRRPLLLVGFAVLPPAGVASQYCPLPAHLTPWPPDSSGNSPGLRSRVR